MGDAKIGFKYIIDDYYEPEYINGVFGGWSSTGELVMNFYLERPQIPNEVVRAINEDGTLSNEEERVDPETIKFRRNIRTGIVMTAQMAQSMYTWLKDRLIEMGVKPDGLCSDDGDQSDRK